MTKPRPNPILRAYAPDIAILSLGLLLLFVPMLQVQVVLGASGDFNSQRIDAELIQSIGEPRTTRPNFIYLAGILTLGQVMPFEMAGVVFSMTFYALIGITTYLLLRQALRVPLATWPERLGLIGLTLLLLIVAPVTLFALPPDLALLDLYLGYIAPMIYHNPTMIPATFFGLLQFYLALRALTAKPATWGLIGVTALVTVLSLFSKPNYTLSLLPVLVGLGGLRQFVLRQRVDWRLIIGGFVLAALPVLAWQYLYTFDRPDELDSDIILKPLAFFEIYGLANIHLIPKFILSILFPLIVLLSYPRAVLRSAALWLAWGVFVVGAAQVYLLAQSGLRQGHGNFLWGAMLALFVLFVASMGFLLGRYRGADARRWRDPRVWLCVAAFGLHVASGLLWYYVNITAAPYPGT